MKPVEETKQEGITWSQIGNVDDLLDQVNRVRINPAREAHEPASEGTIQRREAVWNELKISNFVGEINILSTWKEMLTQEIQCDFDEGKDEDDEVEVVETKHSK